MDTKVVGFLILIATLIVAQYYTKEAFTVQTDCSGSQCVSVSLSDLMSLLYKNNNSTTSDTTTDEKPKDKPISSLDSQFYTNLKGDIIDQIKQSVKEEVTANRTLLVGSQEIDNSCVSATSCDSATSFADMQGQAFLSSAPGKNPNDYIRKDSIPCYGCSLK